MIRSKLQKAAAIAAAAASLFIFSVRGAADKGCFKEEVIYARLASDGALQNVYVVNSFESKNTNTITDYGNYAKISNLTDTTPIKQEGDTILVNLNAGRFYYQGDLKKAELPWLIDISYELNGKAVTATEAAGKSGQMKLRIGISKNPASDPVFAQNYSLQTTVSLPLEQCFAIKADQAVMANAGGKRMLTFTLLPGMQAEYVIETEVSDFSMEGIQFGAIPLSMNIDLPVTADITDQFLELQNGAAKLDDGAASLSDGSEVLRYGMRKLRNGTGELKSGADELADGLKQLDLGTAELNEGSGQLEDGALELANGLGKLTENGNTLKDGADEIFKGLIGMVNEQLKGYKDLFDALGMELPNLTRENYASVLENLLSTIGGAAGQRIFEEVRLEVTAQVIAASERELISGLLARRGLSGEALEDAVNSSLVNESEKTLLLEQAKSLLILQAAENYVLSQDPSLAGDALTHAVDSALRDPSIQSSLIEGVEQQSQEAINDAVSRMMADSSIQKQISDALPHALKNNEQYQALLQLKFQLDGLAVFCEGVYAYTNGVAEAARGTGRLYYGLNEMSAGIGQLHEGTSELSTGAGEFASGVSGLYDGAINLYDGIKRFGEGVDELSKGTAAFREQTSVLNMEGGIDDLLQSVNGQEFSPVSFTDTRNTVTQVQFVMMSEAVNAEDEPLPAPLPEEKLTFWQRLLALFGL